MVCRDRSPSPTDRKPWILLTARAIAAQLASLTELALAFVPPRVTSCRIRIGSLETMICLLGALSRRFRMAVSGIFA